MKVFKINNSRLIRWQFGYILFFIIIEDFCFYWSHRILHLPWLYKQIHKVHHEYNMTISAAAEYAHPLEYLIGNSLPVAAGPLVYGKSKVHLITWFTWVALRTINTSEGHSGYELPWSPFRLFPFSSNSTFHNYHHLKNQGNFGSFLAVWDSLFSTSSSFYRYLKKETD